MPDFKKSGFKKNFNRSGPPRRDFDGPKTLYKAECSKCHNTCEVPFRPNGKKPVFCRDCFQRDDAPRASRDSRDSRGSFGKREYASRTEAPAPDRRIDDLGRKLTMLESKLDNLTRLVEGLTKPVAKETTTPKKVAAKKKAKKA